MPADAVVWIRELRASHQRQASLVARLEPEDLRRPSYDRDWTVTQLLGHMGGNAEITRRRFDVALTGSGSFDRSDARRIWDRWASMEPEAVAEEMVESDRACVGMFESLDERTIRDLRIPSAGTVEDVRDAAAGRLNEHALHSWDTAATFDSAARIAPGSVPLLLSNLLEGPDWLVARMPGGGGADALAAKLGERRLLVRTTDPERWLVVALGAPLRVLPGEPAGREPGLEIPAEAFVRLIYGRLDPDHTPTGIQTRPPLEMDDLRAVFPGF